MFKSFIGGIVFLMGMSLAYWSFDAVGDTEFDETVNGYSGYNYDTMEYTDLSEDPTGGYDGYNYDTHEYFDIEPGETGGFTVFSDE